MYIVSSILADFIFVISSVRAGDIMNGYDSVLLNNTAALLSRWRGESPGDPCYEVGEIQSTNSKTHYFLFALPIELLNHTYPLSYSAP